MVAVKFEEYINDVNENFSGWDFSFITGTGRMKSSLLPWSYGSMARQLMKHANSMLDMGTGGGEFLSKLQPFHETVYATEGYKPNIPIAKKHLEPIGVTVVSVEEDSNLPFSDNQFNVILNQHESYCPKEVRRIINSNGIFLTQQVGGLDCLGINEALGSSINNEFKDWNLTTAMSDLVNNNFEILYCKEEFPTQRFFDIGALVYYLKAIPWQVPDFSVEQYCENLYTIHKHIQSKDFFDVNQHRFIIKALAK
ncbi:methyltransferase domain-containing protein [Cytobacillus sp. IB215665]|uniref:methyltransferase domain-containing protein n=1 Tax=Cytobacillus sp. IB215665 TaxID=3097357 RepID=UPI002A0F08C5|nr:methyltransferase domain-containing protein [Cytobacillus sp. IB215665]MDX8367348.1 methyltransferase domain-containing protein [Cytobacillus sp. IB215665]